MDKSLRTRRPPPQTARPGGAIPRPPKPGGPVPLSARKSRIDDKIKRRMSMRYADADLSAALPIPSVPALPSGRGSRAIERERDREDVREDPRAVDISLLEKEDFNPDAYLKVKLANSTEGELKSLQSSLQASKAATSVDLQRNVFKNYAEFVVISKEISTLENDMQELKDSLAEWKSMPSLLHIDDSATADRRRTQRSSVADLRAIYATELQALHSDIEGSSKFVPITPGRHIISRTSDIFAIHPVTYKVEHAVHFVLLDDALLVAKRRKRRNGEEGRLVADKCWPLFDVIIVDVKDTPELTNVIKLRHGRETYVYRTERLSDKKNLAVSFRQVAEDLNTKKRKEREGEHERRRSVWAGGDSKGFSIPDSSSMPAMPAWMADLAGQGAPNAKDKADADARWVGEFSDDLEVAIALREWDQAVSLAEEGQKKLVTIPTLATKLTPLSASLTSALLYTMADPAHRKTTVTQISALLLRLGAGPAARATFLATRGELLRKRIRLIRFEGDVTLYISDLAIVVFTGVKNTADWYLASFKEPENASYLAEWAKEQIEMYAKMFRSQVYNADIGPDVVADAMQVTRTQSRKLLYDNGLDFSFILEDLMSQPALPPTPQPPPSPRQTAKRLQSQRRPQLETTSGERDGAMLSPSRSVRSPRSPAPPPRSRDRPSSQLSSKF